MEKTTINVFGKNLLIMPNAFITKLSRISKYIVRVLKINQNGCEIQYKIHTKKDFNMTAEEFIMEFKNQNDKICSEFDNENNYGKNYKVFLHNK
jgi:hypothetical protein